VCSSDLEISRIGAPYICIYDISSLRVNVERFNLRKLSELEVRKQYQIEIINRFAALENLNDCEDIKRTWKNNKENIKMDSEIIELLLTTYILCIR
jgi:predicted lipase